MNKQIIDEDAQNEKVMEDMESDFDGFLRVRDFRNAQAVIDNLADMSKWGVAGKLLLKLAAAKMTVPADYGFSKKPDETKDWDNEAKLHEEQREQEHDAFVTRQGGEYSEVW